MRTRLLAAAAVALAAAVPVAGHAAPAGAAACATPWGSLPEAAADRATGAVDGVRSGRHACYDRLVIDLAGPRDGYLVGYVDAVAEEGSGFLVPLRGGARLQVVVAAPAYDAHHRPTFLPRDRAKVVDVAGHRTFRQVAWAGSYEGQTTLGLGVRARLPFRVFTLDGPGGGSRLVVDVAHTW